MLLPTSLPISTEHIAIFMSYLFEKGYSGSSITSFMSALGFFHKVNAFTDPTTCFIVRQQLLSIKKLRPSSDSRKPISESMLFCLLNHLPSLGVSSYEQSLFSAMFLLAFHFGLRVGEITSSPHNIKFQQVVIQKDSITITFNSFKHANDKNPVHSVHSQSQAFCPVVSLTNYVELRGSSDGPLFLLHGKPLLRTSFTSTLKQLLALAGENPNMFNSHSFRIGAASRWAALGLSDVQIKRLGRWNSNANFGYIRGQVTHPPA